MIIFNVDNLTNNALKRTQEHFRVTDIQHRASLTSEEAYHASYWITCSDVHQKALCSRAPLPSGFSVKATGVDKSCNFYFCGCCFQHAVQSISQHYIVKVRPSFSLHYKTCPALIVGQGLQEITVLSLCVPASPADSSIIYLIKCLTFFFLNLSPSHSQRAIQTTVTSGTLNPLVDHLYFTQDKYFTWTEKRCIG